MTVALALPALRALDPVTLEEVVAAADRQVRIDRKYVLPQRAVDGILTAAAETDGVRALEIGGEREFDYASLYFDTPDLLCFHAAGQGRRRRFKVRTRDYLDSGESWLEVKVRGPRGTTVKERMPSAPGLRRLTGEAAAFVTDRLTAHGIEPAPVARMRPELTTTYRRSTLLLDSPRARGRATIDLGMTWVADGTGERRSRSDITIVETKAGATPTHLDRILWSRGHRPVRLSKYGVGVAALDPDARALKWHRVLTRDLGW